MSATAASADATRVRELAMSLGFAAQLRAVTKLGVADALGDSAMTATELAAAVDADAPTLDRLMRALTAHGVFTEVSLGRYEHSGLSRLLREDSPRSMRYMVLWASAPWTWEAWPCLDDAVRSGKAVFPDIYGQEFFEHLKETDPRSAEVFNRAMTQSSRLTSDLVAAALDLGDARTVADVGGGEGHLLATLLRRDPGLRGTLVDLPEVVGGALAELRDGGELADRCRIVGGDCREGVPAGSDLYIFKNVLEWDDESSLAALRNTARAAGPGGRVVLVQNLIEDSSEFKVTTTMDLFLLLNVGGRKHTRDSLTGLFEQSGLKLTGVEQVPGTSLHVVTAAVVR
ncbi:methyltransferase [Actinomadura fibrosa]|uniref:Methyltransferase n=1 Tax=Actinomadura fibrosa TaxID=111802 RepID=A0ABW2Y1T1_9ACTN|nr:methyltransferase [Actinomadura fibrosa]